jgi:hypothetical protein
MNQCIMTQSHLVLNGGIGSSLHAQRLTSSVGLDLSASSGKGSAGSNTLWTRSGKRRKKNKQTEDLAGLNQRHRELLADLNLLEHLGNLKVAAASQISAIDGLNVVADADVLEAGLKG